MPTKIIIRDNGSIRVEGDFTIYDVNGNPENEAAASTSDGITTSWTPMIYSPVHLVHAVANVECGSDSFLGSAVDCALNGKVQTAAR